MAAADVPASAPLKLRLRVGGTAVRVAEAEPEEGRMQRPRRARREVDYRQLEQLGAELQPGTDFAELLASKQSRLLETTPDIVRRIPGASVTPAWLEADGFTSPFIVEDSSSIAGLRMPGPDFSVNMVLADVGGKRELDIIEVATQSELVPKWTLAEWAEYFAKPAADRARILNVISLEVSNTPLRARLSSPAAVRAIDWIETVWPREAEGGAVPAVQYYCLMSVAGSYTDFHIDFGGSSVWYHIVRGEKVFLLVPPTTDNLARFERWCSSPRQSFVFFGDQATHCYKLRIQQGQTFFIPSGWIHAVFTPVDSLVFGGNFVHSLSVEMQLDVAALETRTFVPTKFRFPYFERIHWYAAKKIAERFEAVARGVLPGRPLMPAERRGFAALADKLRLWAETNDEVSGPPPTVQEPLRVAALLKQYTAANADISVSLNAPPLLPLPAPPPLKLRLSTVVRVEDVHSPSSTAAASALAAVASLAAASSPAPVAAGSPAVEVAFKSEHKAETAHAPAPMSAPEPEISVTSPATAPAGAAEAPSGGRVVLKLKKPTRAADEGVVLMSAPRKRHARKDEEDFEYADDADWDEPEAELEEEEDEEEPYAPNGDGDGDADEPEPRPKSGGHGSAKAKAASAAPKASPALAKKIVKKNTTTARQRLQQKLGFHGSAVRSFPQKR